jgi:hypothetical protein
MPPVVVVENDRPVQRLLRWALEEEGLRVETLAPEKAVERIDALIFVLNAHIPLHERLAIAERLHANGARIIDLLTPDELEPPAYADVVVTSPYRASDIVRAIAQLGSS